MTAASPLVDTSKIAPVFKGARFRVGTWFDTDRGVDVYVVEARFPTARRYRGVAVNGRPLAFDERSEAITVKRSLQAWAVIA